MDHLGTQVQREMQMVVQARRVLLFQDSPNLVLLFQLCSAWRLDQRLMDGHGEQHQMEYLELRFGASEMSLDAESGVDLGLSGKGILVISLSFSGGCWPISLLSLCMLDRWVR